jgi:hypothetical protein
MTYHLEIIGAEKGDEEEIDQVGIHQDDVIVGNHDTDNDYNYAHFTPDGSYISTKTKSLICIQHLNEEDMTVTIMVVEKIPDIADIKGSGFFLLESEDSGIYILTKKIKMKEVCTV